MAPMTPADVPRSTVPFDPVAVLAMCVSTAVSVGVIIPEIEVFVAPAGHDVRATDTVTVSTPTVKIPAVVSVVVAAVPIFTVVLAADNVWV
jgi:hypothetical protein